MEWMTREEVERAAKESPRAAIECSIRHHQQLVSATVGEIRNAIREGKVSLYGDFCALCKRYGNNCIGCPIDDGSSTGCIKRCCSEWRAASGFFPPAEYSISTFRAAESKLLARLYKALADCPEEKKQEAKPEIGCGDIVEAGGRQYLAIMKNGDDSIKIWARGYINGTVPTSDTYYKRTGRNVFDDIKAKDC